MLNGFYAICAVYFYSRNTTLNKLKLCLELFVSRIDGKQISTAFDWIAVFVFNSSFSDNFPIFMLCINILQLRGNSAFLCLSLARLLNSNLNYGLGARLWMSGLLKLNILKVRCLFHVKKSRVLWGKIVNVIFWHREWKFLMILYEKLGSHLNLA